MQQVPPLLILRFMVSYKSAFNFKAPEVVFIEEEDKLFLNTLSNQKLQTME